MAAQSTPEILDYRDTDGRGWKFFNIDGYDGFIVYGASYQACVQELAKIKGKVIRDDDVIICAYPKCGTHWLWEVVSMIKAGRVEYTKFRKEVVMLGFPLFERADDMPSPRVLNCHLLPRYLPEQLVSKHTKVLQVLRNPKDAAVSYFCHLSKLPTPIGFDGDFTSFCELYLKGHVPCGSYFDYLKAWTIHRKENPEVMTIFFEDMKKDPVGSVHAVSEFLGEPINDELCAEIAEACSFQRLKVEDASVKAGDDDKMKTFREMGPNVYRKGEVGDWTNWLTVAQNERFDAVIEKELKDTGLNFTYE